MIIEGKKLDGRYIIRAEIGSGGFGAVYSAVDTRFTGSNLVAIKQILLSNEQAKKAFRQEADLLYNLSHPNLPKVTNCFQEEGSNFIVMDYISGEDLLESCKHGKCFSIDESLAIADTVLDALEYLHSFTIFHRDIKPQNIKINEQGKIYLLDFGTAKGNFDETTLTQFGQSITGFTPFYAPLEQVLRVDPNSFLLLQSLDSMYLEDFLTRKTDERSDVYSLGATLYFLLTNFSPEKATSTIRAFSVWSGKPDPLPPCQTKNAEIPDYLARIIHRSLEIEPEKRFQTATEFRRALRNPQAADSAAKISEQMTVVLPDTENPSIRQTELPPSPPVKIVINPVNETIASPIENLFVESRDNRAKPKSRAPIYLGILFAFFMLSILTGFGGWLVWRNRAETPKKIETVAPIAAPTEVKNQRILAYWLSVQKMRDGKKYQEPFESSGREIFETGWQFQIRFTPPDNGFLYVFNEGLNNKGEKYFSVIFPTPKQNDGKTDVEANTQYLSSANDFRGMPGTENFWIVWSKEKSETPEASVKNAFDNIGKVSDEELGKVADLELSAKLKDFLDNGKNIKAEASKDTEKKLTKVDFEGDTLVYLIQLEHR